VTAPAHNRAVKVVTPARRQIAEIAGKAAAGDPRLAPAERNCTVVIGAEGFSARTARPLSEGLATAGPAVVELEFLRPALALPRLPPGTPFQVLVGGARVASGRVLEAAST
jgi:hypothetical protein